MVYSLFVMEGFIMPFSHYIKSVFRIAAVLSIVATGLRFVIQPALVASTIETHGLAPFILVNLFVFFLGGLLLGALIKLPALLMRQRYRDRQLMQSTRLQEKDTKKRTSRYNAQLKQYVRDLPVQQTFTPFATEPTHELTNEEATTLLTSLEPNFKSMRQDIFSDESSRQLRETLSRYDRFRSSDVLDFERVDAQLASIGIPESYRALLQDPKQLIAAYESIQTKYHAFNGQRQALVTGAEGERIVQAELEKYADSYVTLYGNRIAYEEGRTVESDVLVFSEQGVFSVEVKNIKSRGDQAIKISKDGVWYARRHPNEAWQVDEQSSKIFDQMNRQVYGSQKFIFDQTGERKTVHPVIVIANNNAHIENETDWRIIRPNQLYPVISKGPDTLTRETCLSLQALFRSHNLGQKAFKHFDYYGETEVLLDNAAFIHAVAAFCITMMETYNHMEK